MHEDDVEVQFCDLCGTSVPLSDLESGAALRHQAKTIGACCLAVLRQGDSPLASPGTDPRAVAADAGGASRPRNDSLLLPVAIALLAGMAGLAIYLDLKIQDVADQQIKEQRAAASSLSSTSDVLDRVDKSMDGAARKVDLAALQEKLSALDKVVRVNQEQSRQQREAFRTAIDTVQRDVAKFDSQRIDYRPLFDDLRQQIQRQSRAIGDLREVSEASAPVETPRPVYVVEEPIADPGLPADLAVQVNRLADADAAVRFEAVDHLLVSKNLAVLPYLVPMTRDADGFVRRLAVEGLRDFKHPDSVEALLDSLGDGDSTVAETAWSSLKRLTGQKIAFDANAPSKDARSRAQQRWRDWWEKHKDGWGS